jgi:Domain of unknown function (DUF4252)
MRIAGLVLAFAAFAGLATGQQIKWNYDKLAARAVNTVDVTLNSSMLQLASKFLSNDDEDEAQVKKLIEGLKGIYVKSFEFKNPGEYSPADVEAFRSQLRTPEWQRIVGVRSKEDGENVDVYIQSGAKSIGGLAIIATEPKELTLVNIVGPIDLDSLSHLGGQFGIPKVEVPKKK